MEILRMEKKSSSEGNLWKHRNFLKLWAGQTVSFLGSQVTTLALPLTAVIFLQASALQMGVLQAASSLPVLVFGLIAGVWVDRVRRRPLLIGVDIGRAVLLGTIPLAAFFHILHIEQLYVIAFLVGILTIFFDVAHTSFLPSLVERQDLVEGNSKLEVSRAGALIVGPSFAGLLLQIVTAPIAIIIDALSFVGSAIFISWIRVQESLPRADEQKTSAFADIREGLHTVWSQPILRSLALSLGVYNLFSSMLYAMYVLYATRFLQIPPSLLGIVYATGNLGFPIGAMLAQRAMRRFGIGPTIVWAACISDAAFLLIPLANGPVLFAAPLLIAAQFFASLTGPITAINQLSLRQSITPDRLQGRVNGTMRFIALSAAPIGALIAGTIGQTLGLRLAVLIAALGMQLGFVVLLISPVRRFHKQPEVEPEVAPQS